LWRWLRVRWWRSAARMRRPRARRLPRRRAWPRRPSPGGCFWCVESDFDKVPGVLSTVSGYIGGKVANPTYEQVSTKGTGHAEVVEVVYDPKVVSYEQLRRVFLAHIDPTTKDRQFCDAGSPYRTGIFVHDAQQLAAARASLARSWRSPSPSRTRS
jgi:methionine-S-sulfoxide reductase